MQKVNEHICVLWQDYLTSHWMKSVEQCQQLKQRSSARARLLFIVVTPWHRALQRTGPHTSHSGFINLAFRRRLVWPRWSPSLLAREGQEAPHIHLNPIRGQEHVDPWTAGGGDWWSADEEQENVSWAHHKTPFLHRPCRLGDAGQFLAELKLWKWCKWAVLMPFKFLKSAPAPSLN